MAEASASTLQSHFSGFGPNHNVVYELEQVAEADVSPLPRAGGPSGPALAPPPSPPTATLQQDVRAPVKLLERVLATAGEACVFARGAVAWGCLRNAARVVWGAVNSGWAGPYLFGRHTDPLRGVGGVDTEFPPESKEVEEEKLDWRALWRCGVCVLDFLEAVGRNRIEQYFGQGIPLGDKQR